MATPTYNHKKISQYGIRTLENCWELLKTTRVLPDKRHKYVALEDLQNQCLALDFAFSRKEARVGAVRMGPKADLLPVANGGDPAPEGGPAGTAPEEDALHLQRLSCRRLLLFKRRRRLHMFRTDPWCLPRIFFFSRMIRNSTKPAEP